MRIGINLLPLRPGRMGGAEIYFRDLLAELLRRGEHEYVLITAHYNHESLPVDTPGCRRLLFAREGGPARHGLRRAAVSFPPMARTLAWIRRARPATPADTLRDVIRRERLDLWFCPFTNLEPRVTGVPSVITLHDLQQEIYPEFFTPEELVHRRAFYPESCAAAGHIIAVSEFTRRCAIERYGVQPGRISVVWEGAGADVDWAGGGARVAEVRERYRLPERYAFYPANTWHHKNHGRLIEAMARYRTHHDDGLGLVLTGVGENGQRELEAAVAKHELGNVVRELGFVPRADLPALYAGAACLVVPSLFEGFGIPLVEAMLAGCPIAAARATSIPEVVGDAAVLFDPLDPADICRALRAVTRDPARAADLVMRGRARAPLFSVAAMAERTLDVFARTGHEPWPPPARPSVAVAVDGVYGDQWMGRKGARGEDAGGGVSDLPLVTVVTPSFNHGRFIRETIESVLTQSYPRIEYLVVDGGSTDETVAILGSYGDRIAWVSEPDHGQTDAINKGWRRARGTILAYLNSDDLYLPGAVEKAVACLRAHPEAGAVYGEGYHVDEAGRVIERYPTEPFDMTRLAQTCFICQPTVFLRRDIVECLGYLDESLHYCMDYDLWIRLARVSRFTYLPDYLASTRLHARAKTLDQRGPSHAESLRTVHGHFGRVPSQWVYGYADAVLHGRRRDTRGANVSFVVRLIGLSLATFVRYRSPVPRSEWRLWAFWIRHALRRR